MASSKKSFLISALAGELKKERNVLFAYIYGSVLTRRDARDIDIAVYMNGKSDYWTAAQKIAVRIEKNTGYCRKIDIHPLNFSAPSFAFEVMKNGRVMFERRKDDRVNWEAHMLSMYQDMRPMLEFYDRRFISK